MDTSADPKDNASDDDELVTLTRRQLRAIVDHALAHHGRQDALEDRLVDLEGEVERLYLYRSPGTWPMTRRAKDAHYGRATQTAEPTPPKPRRASWEVSS